MAQLFPAMEIINNLLPPPTTGEYYILNFLMRLPDDYEIYFQPNIYGDHPDIVVLNKNLGILVIEVKDYHTGRYNFHDGYWALTFNNQRIESPIRQVRGYRDNLFFNGNCMALYEKMKSERSKGNNGIFAIVSQMVYLHEMTQRDVIEIKAHSDAKYVYVVSHDMLASGHSILPLEFGNARWYFDNRIYTEMRRLLMPSVNTLENAQPIHYSPAQQRLIGSSPVKRVIKGVAGSGKTLVLAQRAVNAYVRTQTEVLILTYNITMCNYIHDRLSAIRGLSRWKNYNISTYHSFITNECKRCGIPLPSREATDEAKANFYKNLDLFNGHNTSQYSAIFIDEAQDYEYNWMRIIQMYFLAENGEFVIFGDEKQNVYGRPLQNRKISTPISGRPSELKESLRLAGNIIMLANDFQEFFFTDRYDLDKIPVQMTLENPYLLYAYIKRSTIPSSMEALFDFLLNQRGINSNDIFVIGTTRRTIQTVFTVLNTSKLGIKCDRTILTNEEERSLRTRIREENRWLEQGHLDKKIKEEIKREERPMKGKFWMNSGCVKLTTIHSMKGWESHTVILLIEDSVDDGGVNTDELIYSGITRGKKNMIIINIENDIYDNFFMKECAKEIITYWDIQGQR